jgi:hypothetical protein
MALGHQTFLKILVKNLLTLSHYIISSCFMYSHKLVVVPALLPAASCPLIQLEPQLSTEHNTF